MKCLAVELKGSQWAFYLILGLLAIVFLIMNVLWYLTTDWGVGALIAMVFCPLVLCYLAFDSFRQYRRKKGAGRIPCTVSLCATTCSITSSGPSTKAEQ